MEIRQKYKISRPSQILRIQIESKVNSWRPGHLRMLPIWLARMKMESIHPKVGWSVCEKAPWRSSRYPWCRRIRPSRLGNRKTSRRKAMMKPEEKRQVIIGEKSSKRRAKAPLIIKLMRSILDCCNQRTTIRQEIPTKAMEDSSSAKTMKWKWIELKTPKIRTTTPTNRNAHLKLNWTSCLTKEQGKAWTIRWTSIHQSHRASLTKPQPKTMTKIPLSGPANHRPATWRIPSISRLRS